MAKDMREIKDNATLIKLDIFERYVDEWLYVTLNNPINTLEIYDLFCGSGFDGTTKGSPLRILDAVLKRDRKGKKIKIYFNDNDKSKVDSLKQSIEKSYKDLQSKQIELAFSYEDVANYQISSNNYYRLIFLDQYGIKYINKIEEFLRKGTDILIFISSGHFRRFLEEESFQKYFDIKLISKNDFEEKTSYETHRVIAEYFKKKFNNSYIAPFSLIKDNGNINGLIFISNHRKGQEQFLKTAWAIDTDCGEGNKNLDGDFTKDKSSLFYDTNEPSEKEKKYKENLIDFIKEAKSNIEIKNFGLDNGFLPTHTHKILEEIKENLECKYFNGAKKGFHLDNKKDEKKIEIRYKANETN